MLTKAYREMNARVQALRFSSNYDPAKWKQAVKEHEQMIEALQARDGASLRAILLEHLLRKRDTVLEQLRSGAAYTRATATP
jgi:DNA-binding GntR family transcriptional regulator